MRQKLSLFKGRIESKAQNTRRAFLQFMHNRGGESRPAFLIGSGRSGTSMIVRQLAKSWQVELFNENHPLAFVNYRLRDLEVVEELVARSRAPLTLFKPIHNTSQAQIFLSRFPTAKLLFIFRHYDDVINSSLSRFRKDNRLQHVRSWIQEDFAQFDFARPPNATREHIRSRWKSGLTCEDGAALYWLFYNRLYHDLDLSSNKRVKLVHYKSVVTNSEPEIRRITDFLNIRFEEKMSAGIFATSVRKERSPMVGEEIRADCEELYCRLLASASNQSY